MADETKTSLMMKFEDSGGPVEAECPLVIFSGDTLATTRFQVPVLNSDRVEVPGFVPTSPHGVSRYFLIKSFGFNANLSDGETRNTGAGSTKTNAATPATGRSGPGAPPATGAGGSHRHAAGGLALGHTGGAGGAASSAGLPFAQWRSATGDSWKKDGNYASHIDDFRFTRFVDSATNALFTACCKGTSFKSASLIKRKASRTINSNTFVDLAYLRIDFVGVKITELTWADGDILEETCKFTCDGMQISYAAQDMTGNLARAAAPRHLEQPDNADRRPRNRIVVTARQAEEPRHG